MLIIFGIIDSFICYPSILSSQEKNKASMARCLIFLQLKTLYKIFIDISETLVYNVYQDRKFKKYR